MSSNRQYRLTFDVPYDFAVEPGYARSVHCADFHADKDSFVDTWRDPTTGLVMLRPNFLERDYKDQMRPLSDFNKQDDFWKTSIRSADGTQMFSSVKPADSVANLIEIPLTIALVVIDASGANLDDLKWALETSFSLSVDESFALHYHGITDEMQRKNNWLGVQWDDILILMSHQGTVRVYQYADRSDLTVTPTQIDQFDLALPSELLNRPGYFIFIPIPGLGLLLHHGQNAPKSFAQHANVQDGISRGYLIPWPTRTISNVDRLFESSPVRIAVNPYQKHLFGFQHVRFKTSGTYLDGAFDPGYKPSATPTTESAVALPTQIQTVTAEVRKTDDSAVWAAGVDRLGRMKCSLTTTDDSYTPFLFGYFMQWVPILATRNTTPVSPDKVFRIEYTTDEWYRREGYCEVLMESPEAQRIAERGDSTFLLERSDDAGGTWYTIFGGFAKHWQNELVVHQDDDGNGRKSYWKSSCGLFDLWERFREQHNQFYSSFDGITPGLAVNVVLQSAGFPAIREEILPAGWTDFTLPRPNTGHTWRFSPKMGDTGEQCLFSILLLVRREDVEWTVLYDWDAQEWVPFQKPKDTDTILSLTPFKNQESEREGVYRMNSFVMAPESPEGNVFQVRGIKQPDPIGVLINSTPQVNRPSLEDTSSPDYLGRILFCLWMIFELSNQADVDTFAKVLYKAGAHARKKSDVRLPLYFDALAPNVCVRPLRHDGTPIDTFWVKRQTVIITEGNWGLETMQLAIDTVWEGAIRG